MVHTALYQRAILILFIACAFACSDDEGSTEEGIIEAPDGGESMESDEMDNDDEDPGMGMGMMEPGSAYNGVESDVDDGEVLPIIFVHGFVGSAQQYQSQAMRWELNGYPRELIRAYDHDGAGREIAEYADGVDEFIEQMFEDFPEYDQVYLVGHSRGTATSMNYLGDEARRAKVAKYIALDGAPCPDFIACLAPNQARLPGQAHVEVATSPESFAMQYEFLMGEEPETVEITPQEGTVTLNGRVVNFPENTGRDGALFKLWEIDAETGERVADEPVAEFEIDETGEWGPIEVDPDKYYEQHLSSEDADSEQHLYTQRYIRNSDLVRVLTQNPETSTTRGNSNLGPDHATIIAVRMREWYGTDVLNISVDSENGESTEPVDALGDMMGSGAANRNIALHIHDDAESPKESTLDPLPYFPSQPFQTGMDLYIPAADPPNGTVTVTNFPRGDESKPQTLHFPNWSSDKHSITVYFSDYAQD